MRPSSSAFKASTFYFDPLNNFQSELLLREPNHRHLLSMQINLLIPMLHVCKLNFASGLKPTLAANLFRIGVCAQWYNTNTISSVIDTSLIIEGAKTILLNTCRHALNNSVSLVLVQQWHFRLPPSFFLFFFFWCHLVSSSIANDVQNNN